MREFLLSVGYDRWILPVLLALPLIGAAAVLVSGRGASGGDEVATGAAARPPSLATWCFGLEFLLSVGLWWGVGPGTGGWQQRFDVAGLPTGGAAVLVGVDSAL